MGGIAGFVGEKNKKVAVKMQKTLKRRGQGGGQIYANDFATLIYAGQELPTTYGDLTIAYDGRLYNADDVRQELISVGHGLDDQSDGEIILHAYLEWGAECLQKLNGVFAFAILDTVKNKLFLARDRMGVKPLFYFWDKKYLVFGSEIPTVLSNPVVPHIIDKTGVQDLILLGPGRIQGSGIIKNVYELCPAEFAVYYNNKIKKQTYWKLKDEKYTKTYEEAVSDVRELAVDAIRRQLVCDTRVGTLLSGGIDSSVISALASKQVKNLQTFSVDYFGNKKYFVPNKFQPSHDKYYIDLMNKHIGTPGNKTVIKTDELVKSLTWAVDARGLPGMADVDGSLLLFCKNIKKRVPIVLSGECADELFGGYPWFYRREIMERDGFPWCQNIYFRIGLLQDKWTKSVDLEKYYPKKPKDMKAITKMTIDWFMQTLIDRSDRMAMHSGLEIRVPFCDYRVAEFAYNLPDEYKFRNGVEKSILRDAFRDILPPEVVNRKKSPYPKTHNPEYLAAVKKILTRIAGDETQPIHKVIKKSTLISLLNSADNSTPFYGQLMTVPQTMAYMIQFNYWLKKFNIVIVD